MPRRLGALQSGRGIKPAVEFFNQSITAPERGHPLVGRRAAEKCRPFRRKAVLSKFFDEQIRARFGFERGRQFALVAEQTAQTQFIRKIKQRPPRAEILDPNNVVLRRVFAQIRHRGAHRIGEVAVKFDRVGGQSEARRLAPNPMLQKRPTGGVRQQQHRPQQNPQRSPRPPQRLRRQRRRHRRERRDQNEKANLRPRPIARLRRRQRQQKSLQNRHRKILRHAILAQILPPSRRRYFFFFLASLAVFFADGRNQKTAVPKIFPTTKIVRAKRQTTARPATRACRFD